VSKINLGHTRTTFCICGLMVLCMSGTQASTLLADPNNGALLYYQAFLLRPEPDYVTDQIIRKIQSEDFDKFLRSGKLEFGTDTEEQIRAHEEKLKNYAADPNKARPEFDEMMPEGQYEGYLHSALDQLRERLEYEQKMAGVDPNKTIRDYMRECRGAIELAQAASEMPRCDWGLLYSRGFTLGPPILVKIKGGLTCEVRQAGL